MSDNKFEMDPGFFLETAKEPLAPTQVRAMFAKKVVNHVREATEGSLTFGSDIEFCVADYADAYPGFDALAATEFANAVLLRTDKAVRLGQDDQFRPDLAKLLESYIAL